MTTKEITTINKNGRKINRSKCYDNLSHLCRNIDQLPEVNTGDIKRKKNKKKRSFYSR